MKRFICVVMIAVIAACALSGCAKKTDIGPFEAQNEILTYERIDPEKTQLTVASLGNNANITDLTEEFERLNPDIQVICMDVTGGNSGYRPIVDWVTHGVAPDVVFVNRDSFVDDAQTIEYFEDLSACPSIENFEAEALGELAVKGRAYFLPAPSEINCITYNKTLFDEYGWQVPATFDEFVALCVKIREDTQGQVQPWNPNAKYDSVFSTALEAFSYEELFSGVDNRGWYNEFCAGKAKFAGHMEPFYQMIQTLIDNKILLEEHFNYSATTRGKEFQQGRIAMYNAPVGVMNGDGYEFGFMPYPSTTGKLGYVNEFFTALVGVPKKERSDSLQKALDSFLAFFGSADGQRALIGDSLMVSNVKNVPLNGSGAMEGIEAVIARGHKFSRLDFPGAGERIWTFRNDALKLLKGEATVDSIIAAIDEEPYVSLEESDTAKPRKLASTEDMSIFEFSCYIADMYREKAAADIGLINHAVAYRGNLVRLFKGDLYDGYVTVLKPRSFANNSTLVKLSMTGAQILSALNNPVGNDCVTDSVYAFSGLKCEIAPWNELGKKYLKVETADGKKLEEDRLYTVAAWEGTIACEYITQTLEAFEGSWEELMTAKLASDKTLSPANDARAKLVWN